MKRIIIALLLAALAIASLSGCDVVDQVKKDMMSELNEAVNEAQSEIDGAKKDIESGVKDAQSALDEAKQEISSSLKDAESTIDALKGDNVKSDSGKSADKTYTMADIGKLKDTDHFAEGAVDHIFDGTINKKGEATGYHYDPVSDSKGSIISGTESEPDRHGVFTAKVKVSGVKKKGFSSFYPSDWTPQQVVDAINEAYDDALSDSSNPQGSLWIGFAGDLEIDMYLNNKKQITTAYPIYEED